MAEALRSLTMETLISLLVILAIIGIVYWAVTQIPLPPPMGMVLNVVIAIVAILLLVQFVGFPSAHHVVLR